MNWVRFFNYSHEGAAGVKPILLSIFTATWAMGGQVDVYSVKDLEALGQKLSQKRTQFASQELERYGNHYTMLAFREKTGSSEVHEHEADVFVVVSGEATLVTGGKVVNPRTERAGEIRGTSIEGGENHKIGTGDIMHIAAKTPHQLLIENGKPFTYFVVKVTGQ
jgi:mannose-6-phosphate isomerase-like protein (cupin superfamily)